MRRRRDPPAHAQRCRLDPRRSWSTRSTRSGTKVRGDDMHTNEYSGELGHWPDDSAAAYEQAIDIYRALVAVLNARADHEPDPAAAGQLRSDAVEYAAEQRHLRATDHDAIARVVSQYPARVRALAAGLPE
jgi:hypothetical protein